MISRNNWYKITTFSCSEIQNYFDASLKQCKHKNGEKDQYTLIEQSRTPIEQSPTSNKTVTYSNRTVSYFNAMVIYSNTTVLYFNITATYSEISQPRVCISKIGFTSINLLSLQY